MSRQSSAKRELRVEEKIAEHNDGMTVVGDERRDKRTITTGHEVFRIGSRMLRSHRITDQP